MKNFVDILNEAAGLTMKKGESFYSLTEETVAGDIPQSVVSSWKRVIDYDEKMKRKFSYFDVAFKSKNMSVGHKGQMTKVNKEFEQAMSDNGLDPNLTIKKLMNLYPPKHI